MHDVAVRQLALDLLDVGLTRRDVCRILDVGYNSTYRWQERLEPAASSATIIRCFRCVGAPPDDPGAYLYLLGQYLGDGHLRRSGRSICLSISCCTDYPGIMAAVGKAMTDVTNVSVFHRGRPGVACVCVESNTMHWLHMLPQHGPGLKHARRIVLEPWQVELVDADPRPLIRGLLHSDGWRGTNWTTRTVGGTTKKYTYSRYQFSNMSADIRGIFTSALDRLGIAWRQNNHNSISVARRAAVAALDEFVGPKT
jgi:hypothetical protein